MLYHFQALIAIFFVQMQGFLKQKWGKNRKSERFKLIWVNSGSHDVKWPIMMRYERLEKRRFMARNRTIPNNIMHCLPVTPERRLPAAWSREDYSLKTTRRWDQFDLTAGWLFVVAVYTFSQAVRWFSLRHFTPILRHFPVGRHRDAWTYVF